MGFTLETGVSAAAVFLQGILSFFSPCVLPLVPLYIGYLAGGAKSVDADGTVRYKRGRVMRNTVFFVLGVSFTFFALGLGFTALGRFFSDNRALFARIGGVLIILFGLYQLGVFRSRALSTERRLPIRLDRLSMNPAVAFLFGFTFSFAWTPCVGPALGSVLIMATSAGSSAQGFLLIGVYTLGFVLPFLAVGLFTGSLLDFFKKHQKAVRYTVKAGGVLMILMGVMMLTGWMNGFTSYLSGLGGAGTSASSAAPSSSVPSDSAAGQGGDASSGPDNASASSGSAASSEQPEIPAPDFTLTDQFGKTHTLSDYQGQVVFLNFWATWCGPCQREMPDIQAMYEDLGLNEEDVVVLAVANPKSDQYPYNQDVSEDEVKRFLEENGYTYGYHGRGVRGIRCAGLSHNVYDRPGGQCVWLCGKHIDAGHHGQHRSADAGRQARGLTERRKISRRPGGKMPGAPCLISSGWWAGNGCPAGKAYREAICAAISSSQARMACSVLSRSLSSSQPRRSAPWRMTSREQPAANFLSLNFFFRLESSISCTLFEGRISAAAPTRPVSSSAANNTFSISSTGSTSLHRP